MKFKRRLKLAWSIIRASDTSTSNLFSHAHRELALRLPDDPTDDLSNRMNVGMREAVEDMMLVFALEGHSGFSASYALDIFQRLAKFQPLTPLTGEDDEWNQVAEDMWQNRRCSNIFKNSSGGAYVSDHYVFRDPDGAHFIGFGSQKRITFPYSPEDPIIVRVDEDGEPIARKHKHLRKPRSVPKEIQR